MEGTLSASLVFYPVLLFSFEILLENKVINGGASVDIVEIIWSINIQLMSL